MQEYLTKHNLKTKEDIAQHIVELKRNTVPNLGLISSLCSYLFPAEKTENKGILNDHVKEILKDAGTKEHGEVKPNSTRHKAPVHCGGYGKIKFYSKDNGLLSKEPFYNFLDGEIKKYNFPKEEPIFKDNPNLGVDFLEMGQIVGKKENKGKPQLSLLFTQFPKALEGIAKCSEYGHEKYKETDQDYLNYQRVEGGSKTYADAGLRHRTFPKGTTDIDSQLPHAYHVAWNALAELQLWIQENE